MSHRQDASDPNYDSLHGLCSPPLAPSCLPCPVPDLGLCVLEAQVLLSAQPRFCLAPL